MLTAYETVVPDYMSLSPHDQEVVRQTVRGVEKVYGDLSNQSIRLDKDIVRVAIDHALRTCVGMSYDKVFVRSRKMDLMQARQMIILACHRKFCNPLQFWGRFFERCHASIIHGIRTAEGYITYDKVYKQTYENIYESLENYLNTAGVCNKGERGLVV